MISGPCSENQPGHYFFLKKGWRCGIGSVAISYFWCQLRTLKKNLLPTFALSCMFFLSWLPPPSSPPFSVAEGSTAQGSWQECHAFYQKTEVWRLTSGSYGRAVGYLAKDRGEEGCLSGRASISVLWPSLVPGRRANPARVSAGRGQAPVCFTSYSIHREGCVYPPTDPHTI